MSRTIWYSATEGAFTFSDVHGPKTYMTPNPEWVRPTKKVPDPSWQRPMIAVPVAAAKRKKGSLAEAEPGPQPVRYMYDESAEHPMIEVPDEDAKPDEIELRNPRIPEDAVEVSEEDYAALMEAQKRPHWKLIVPDENGYPRAADAPDERLAGQWRVIRDELLLEADRLTQLDRWERYTPERKAEITAYKEALRTLPEQPGWPRQVTLPEKP